MCKRLIFLISFVLVLGLAGYTSAAVDANIPKTGIPAPVIDGIKEGVWLPSEGHPMIFTVQGSAPDSPADCSGSWWALCDSDYLYVFIDVNDYDLWNDSSGESYQDDSVEVCIDIGNDKNDQETGYGEDDYQYRVGWNSDPNVKDLEEKWHPDRSFVGVEFIVLTKDDDMGYTLEIKFPWETLDVDDRGLTTLGDFLGFLATINDDDAGGARDAQLSWLPDTANAWINPSLFGTVVFAPGLNKAYNPNPQDGAEGVLVGLLQWTAGVDAVSHNVYFDPCEAKVQARSGCDVNDVNHPDPNYPLTGLVPETTYYWCIDEVNDPCLWPGDIWSFTTGPLIAHHPDPYDGERWVDVDKDLTWMSGVKAQSHDVYFGTDETAVATADQDSDEFIDNRATTVYDPDTLIDNKTYYWRIDEVNTNDPNLWPGDVWSFTTLSVKAGILGEYYNNKNLSGQAVLTRTDYSIDFDWGPESPDSKLINADDFSVRWTAELEVPYTETYTFITLRDKKDGVRLYIGGQLIIDDWPGNNTLPEEDSAIIDLDAGLVPIVMEYRDAGQTALAKLKWESLSIEPNEVIPRDTFFLPLRAVSPNPPNGATGVQSAPVLSWSPGMFTATHDVYFSTDESKVTDANRTNQLDVLVMQDLTSVRPRTAYDGLGIQEFSTTYYWRIDDINGLDIWRGGVWSFTTDGYHVVDDMEKYTDAASIGAVWHDGTGGSDITTSTDPSVATQIHGGAQAMAYSYDNSASPYYSEAYADTNEVNEPDSLDFGIDWRLEGVKALSLWFRGAPDLRGSFTEAAGTYTLTADGKGISGTADSCFLVYGQASGNVGSIYARVLSVEKIDPFAKAGVMIRDTLAPDARFGAVTVTPENGVIFQYRTTQGGNASSVIKTEITAPCWVKVEAVHPPYQPYFIKGYYAITDDVPTSWTLIGQAQVTLGTPIYPGLCVTSSSYGEMCTAEISNVTTTPATTLTNTQDITKAYNDAEEMYVVLEDSDSNGIVYHPDPNVTQIGTWTEWRIDLNDFNDQDVNLTDVQKMYIGFGDEAAPGGSGIVFIDDIRLYLAEFYAPECPWKPDLIRDGVIGYGDLEMVADNWLISDYNVEPNAPYRGPVSRYQLDGNANDTGSGTHYNGEPCGVGVAYNTTNYKDASASLELTGDGSWISTDACAEDYGIDGNKPRTITAWAYARDFSDDAGIYEIGEQADGRDFALRVTAEPNVWRAQHWGEDYDIDFTYPSLDRWVHFAHVYDGTTVRVYADGYFIPDAERVLNLDTSAETGAKTFKIGRWSMSDPAAIYYFDGLIDDVHIYNYALDQANAAYLAGKTGEFAQPLHLLMTPTNPDIDVYGDGTIDFKDIAEMGNVWGKEKVWPTW